MANPVCSESNGESLLSDIAESQLWVDKVNPKGAKAREPYQNLDGESQLSESIASSPYRGRPWRGWMSLCFFLCARESKESGVWGDPPAVLALHDTLN